MGSGVIMKALILFCSAYFMSTYTFALGDPSGLPNPTQTMKDTTTTMNQVTPEREVRRTPPQDLQEMNYQDDLEREREEWEEQKRHSDYTRSEEFQDEKDKQSP